MSNVSITINDKAVTDALSRLSAAGGNMGRAMADIGDMMVSRITEGFDQGESPYGEKWKPLADDTKHGRLRHNKSNFRKNGKLSAKGRRESASGFQPLVDTGNLRNSITRNVSGNSVEVGTDLIYGATHQFGSENGDIPARPFLPTDGLPDAWAQEAVDSIGEQIMKAVK